MQLRQKIEEKKICFNIMENHQTYDNVFVIIFDFNNK